MRVFHLQGSEERKKTKIAGCHIFCEGEKQSQAKESTVTCMWPVTQYRRPATDPEDPERSEIRREFCYLPEASSSNDRP